MVGHVQAGLGRGAVIRRSGFARGGPGGLEVGQGIPPLDRGGQRDVAQQAGGLGEQPVEGADALFEFAVFGLGVDVVPEGVAQGCGEGVAVGQAG